MNLYRVILAIPLLVALTVSCADLRSLPTTQNLRDHTVMIQTEGSMGSGVLFKHDDRLFVLTACNVLGTETGFKVRMLSGQEFDVYVISKDAQLDIALLGVKLFVPMIREFSGQDAQLEQPVRLIGHALGPAFPWTVSPGNVIATNATPTNLPGWPWTHPLNAVDACGAAGMSGCGVWASDGKLLGIFVGAAHDLRVYVPWYQVKNFLKKAGYEGIIR